MTPLFLLGGHDLEMLTIRELLQAYAPDCFIDKGLSWGASASDYRVEITDALQEGKTPVLVELTDDMGIEHHPHPDPLPQGEGGVIQIDHHGPLAGAGRPTALHQVFKLLGLPPEAWTRRMELVAANDRGHIKGMLEVGATMDEIVAIRTADRTAQGITPEQEQQAEQAIRSLEQLCEGRLTVVRLPHSRTAAVADRLAPELGGIGYENLLVISPQEVNFFGKGAVVVALDNEFAGGWYGGSLPEYGFWGAPMADAHAVLTFLQELLHGKLYYTSV